MQILITHFSTYDIEVVDNYVYLYPNGTFELDDKTIPGLLKLSEWLYDEFEQNTHRYKDDQISTFTQNTVAEPGRRLLRRLRIKPSIVILFVLYMVMLLAVAAIFH